MSESLHNRQQHTIIIIIVPIDVYTEVHTLMVLVIMIMWLVSQVG